MSLNTFGHSEQNQQLSFFMPQTRAFDDMCRKMFVIGFYHVRAYLAPKEKDLVRLQVSFCQLQRKLKDMVKREYLKKYINIHDEESMYTYKNYKRFLVATCLIYYFLWYVHGMEEGPEEILNMVSEDFFFSVILNELTDKLSLFVCTQQHWVETASMFNPDLNLSSPPKESFYILLTMLIEQEKKYDNAHLLLKIKNLLRGMFGVFANMYIKEFTSEYTSLEE